MSKYQLEKQMRNELLSLNKIIDRKIMLGLSYNREARDHKALLARIMRLKHATGRSIFDRFSFASGLF
ncbi:MAG: hypothetical protein JWN50_190 [Parcubacteria group bacterium]|nr:hypothetical protein [Parcubacteria group bacterium]